MPAFPVRRLFRAGGAICVSTTVVLGVVATATPPAAAVTVPLGTYTASLPVEPFYVVSSSVDPSQVGFPVTFKNTSPNGYFVSQVQATVPADFGSPTGASVSAAGWTVSTSGHTVTASTSNPLGNGVPAGGTVRLTFSATAPASSGTETISTAAAGIVASTGLAGDFTNSGSDPQVTTAPYANVVTCAPNVQCDTGVVGASSNTTARIVTTTGTIQDWLSIAVGPPTDAPCLALTSANGRSQQVSFTDIDTSRTLTQTLQIDKSVVNQLPNNGASKYGICYDTASTSKTFVDKNGAVTSAGFLPMCSASGLLPRQPCIVSITKTQAGDVIITFTAPGGDPYNIGGIPLL